MAESAASMTTYQYANNNPVMFNDPNGDIPISNPASRLGYGSGGGGDLDGDGSLSAYDAEGILEGFDGGEGTNYGTANFSYTFGGYGFLNQVSSGITSGYYYTYSKGTAGKQYTYDAGSGAIISSMANGLNGNTFLAYYHNFQTLDNGLGTKTIMDYASYGFTDIAGNSLGYGPNDDVSANQGGDNGGPTNMDRGLALFGAGASATENLSGITRIGSNLALYAASRNGGVFMGNQFVKTFSVSRIGRIAGITGAVVGTGLDLYGVYKGTTTWGQAGENGVFTAIGLYGGPVGAVISVGYFGLNAFYPGGANQAASDFSNSWSQHAQQWGQVKMESGGL